MCVCLVQPQSDVSDFVVSPWEALTFLRCGAGMEQEMGGTEEGEGAGMGIAM